MKSTNLADFPSAFSSDIKYLASGLYHIEKVLLEIKYFFFFFLHVFMMLESLIINRQQWLIILNNIVSKSCYFHPPNVVCGHFFPSHRLQHLLLALNSVYV